MSDLALQSIEAHAEAVNARDTARYIATMSFPFTYQNYNGVALTIETPEDVGVTAPLPWDIILSTDPAWSHTRFDAIEEVARSVSSLVVKVSFCRVDQAGQESRLYDAIWIATCQADTWGVQFRHNLGERRS